MDVIFGVFTLHFMLSPTTPAYSHLASATSRAMNDMQRSLGGLLEGESAQKVLKKGDTGMYAFASRLDLGVKVKQSQITSLQNAVTFSHAQEAALSAAESVFFRMSEIAVRATDTMLTDADRRNLNLEFNELRNFSNKIGEEKILGNELFPSSSGGTQLGDHSTTAGNNSKGVSLSNEMAFGVGGTLYFTSLDDTPGATITFHCVLESDEAQYIGAVALSLRDGLDAIKDKSFIYKTTNDVFFSADFTGYADQQYPGPKFKPIQTEAVDLPQFADASDLNLLTRSNASSAVTTLNSYVEQLAEQKAILGANLSDLEVSMDRLSRQVLAGKVSLERMTAEEMQDDLGRISQSIISWEKNTALMAQAKHINENLINILL